MTRLRYAFIRAVRGIVWTKSSGDTITSEEKPLLVPEGIITAYERRTGFAGFGEFLEQIGEITILRGKSC